MACVAYGIFVRPVGMTVCVCVCVTRAYSASDLGGVLGGPQVDERGLVVCRGVYDQAPVISPEGGRIVDSGG